MINKKNITNTVYVLMFLLYIFSIWYVESIELNKLLVVYFLGYTLYIVVSLFNHLSEYLEEYYWNKREYKNREQSREQGTI